jgi:hypothetical protein
MNICTPFCAKNGSQMRIYYDEHRAVEAFGSDDYNRFLHRGIIGMDRLALS